MVASSKAGQTPVKPIAVGANRTQKSASLLGMRSPLLGATTLTRGWCETTWQRGLSMGSFPLHTVDILRGRIM